MRIAAAAWMWNVESTAMSEFKYACPVCGQHIKCDSTQSGSVMECPTCLQQIIAPQAPAGDQKFILSGKKLGEAPKTQMFAPLSPEPVRRSFPVAAVALVLLIVCTAVAIVFFRDKIFKSGDQSGPARPINNPQSPQAGATPQKADAPPVVIPHASDTNWLLSLDSVAFPDSPAAGRIHGEDFLCERSFLQSGALTLREGTKGALNYGLIINFSGARPETLAGKTINVTTNAPIAAHVTLRWTEGGQDVKGNFDTGYALRLEFGLLNKNHLPGKIYFCAPDDSKSYVAGTFNAEIRKPKAPKPKP